MKVSFDLDGTYLEYPDTFDALAVMLQMSGHEVGILTNRREDERPDIGFETDFEYFLGQSEEEFTAQERCAGKVEKMIEELVDMHYDDEAAFFPDSEKVIIEIE